MESQVQASLLDVIGTFCAKGLNGFTLTEDEVMFYNQSCNTMKSIFRFMELQYLKQVAIEEKDATNREQNTG